VFLSGFRELEGIVIQAMDKPLSPTPVGFANLSVVCLLGSFRVELDELLKVLFFAYLTSGILRTEKSESKPLRTGVEKPLNAAGTKSGTILKYGLLVHLRAG